MKLLFMGVQGSGKGTQAKIISVKLGVPHISTGDLLRGATQELKKEIDSYIAVGILVPDELMLRVLNARLLLEDCNGGFILDGYPRNIVQAKKLDEITTIDKVIEIVISDEEAFIRAIYRVTCSKCGEGYNTKTNSSKKIGICDKCNGILTKRADDNEQAMLKRIEIYHKETEPILKHYESVKVNGAQKIELVSKDILMVLGLRINNFLETFYYF